MKRMLSVCVMIGALALVTECGSDDADPGAADVSVGGAAASGGKIQDSSAGVGNGGGSGGSGSGATGGSGASGGSDSGGSQSSAWPPGRGNPGTITTIATGLPHVQGVSGLTSRVGLTQMRVLGGTLEILTGESKCPMGYDSGIVNTVDGGDGGLVSFDGGCTGFSPPEPSYSLADVDETTIALAMPTIPIFEPADSMCATQKSLLKNGRLFLADCTGSLQELPVFDADDVSGFFGKGTMFLRQDNIPIQGVDFSILTGLAVKSALCSDRVFLVSNAASKIVEIDLSHTDAGYTRTDHDVGGIGLSGLLCGSEPGRVIFTTSRTWTTPSWNTAGGANDPSLLVVADELELRELDTSTGDVTTLATISGGAKVISQNWSPVSFNDAGMSTSVFMHGISNALTRATDGDILLGDHLAGAVWKISPDGATQTMLFESDQLFTGIVQAPNGQIYMALNATADMSCNTIRRPPTIAAWNEEFDFVEFWLELDHPDYDVLLPRLCNSGIIERDWSGIGSILIGGGNFNDLVIDPNYPVIMVTETLLSQMRAVTVDFVPSDAGPDAADGSDADAESNPDEGDASGD